MKKLKLSMDALHVETFETLAIAWREVGTVQGRAAAGTALFADDKTDASCESCVDCQLCKCKDSTLV